MNIKKIAKLTMVFTLSLAALLVLTSEQAFSSMRAPSLQTGDLIFQISQSSQSAALQESTGSQWTHVGVIAQSKSGFVVYEAVQPVKITPLKNFVARGKNQTFVVKRVKAEVFDTKSTEFQTELIRELTQYLNLPYDIFFEWSEDRIYCSEYAFKAFAAVSNLEIGKVQRTGELRLDGPHVKKLILDRLTSIGKKINLNEPIITPVSMFESTALELVFDSRAAPLTTAF